MLYLWILLPLCERPILENVLQSKYNQLHFHFIRIDSLLSILAMEKHGDHPKDDVRLRPIICFLEGAVHNILQDYNYAQNVEFLIYWKTLFPFVSFSEFKCYEEALARVDDSKLIFTRYILPFATCELGIIEYLFRQVEKFRFEFLFCNFFFRLEYRTSQRIANKSKGNKWNDFWDRSIVCLSFRRNTLTSILTIVYKFVQQRHWNCSSLAIQPKQINKIRWNHFIQNPFFSLTFPSSSYCC